MVHLYEVVEKGTEQGFRLETSPFLVSDRPTLSKNDPITPPFLKNNNNNNKAHIIFIRTLNY